MPGPARSARRPAPKKICFFFSDLHDLGLSQGGLAVLPAPLDPISIRTVETESSLGASSATAGVNFLVEPLRVALREKRLLMGWSRYRSGPKVLTWAGWDAFVKLWFDTDEHRSPDRKDVLDSDVLTAEILWLKGQGLITVIGSLPGSTAAAADVPAKASGRRRRRVEDDAEDDDDQDED